MRNPLSAAPAFSTGSVLLLLTLLPSVGFAQGSSTRYVNPSGLVKPTGYTHVVIAPDGRTVYIAGQVAFDSTVQSWVKVILPPKPSRCIRIWSEHYRALADLWQTWSRQRPS